jgi:DNA primase
VLVSEGPFDAIAIGGVAVLGNQVNDIQAEVIERLNRQIIVVPDSDSDGGLLIDAAIEYNWDVCFPTWLETCKDANDAVIKYGKIFTIKDILENTMTTTLKIKMMKRKIYE